MRKDATRTQIAAQWNVERLIAPGGKLEDVSHQQIQIITQRGHVEKTTVSVRLPSARPTSTW